MIIEDLLLTTSDWVPMDGEPYDQALYDEDALREAQLLDVRLDAVTQTAALLFELRTSLQYDVTTGVVLARQVRDLSWTAAERPGPRVAWSVATMRTSEDARGLSLSVWLWPDPGARLSLNADALAFACGDVPGLGWTMADYGEDDDATVRAWTATWSSPIELAGFWMRLPSARHSVPRVPDAT